MKTLKTLLVIAAATMTVSVFAGDASQDPNLVAGPRLGKATPNTVVAAPSGYQDPNLIPQKWGGKQPVQTKVAASSSAENTDTLAGTKCRGMSSKNKDTAKCAEHCAKFAKQQ